MHRPQLPKAARSRPLLKLLAQGHALRAARARPRAQSRAHSKPRSLKKPHSLKATSLSSVPRSRLPPRSKSKPRSLIAALAHSRARSDSRACLAVCLLCTLLSMLYGSCSLAMGHWFQNQYCCAHVSPVRAREAALPRMLVCMRVLCLHVFVTV